MTLSTPTPGPTPVAAAITARYSSSVPQFAGNPGSVSISDTTEISIFIKNGVATLSGKVSHIDEATLAEQQLSRLSGIKQIINLISIS